MMNTPGESPAQNNFQEAVRLASGTLEWIRDTPNLTEILTVDLERMSLDLRMIETAIQTELGLRGAGEQVDLG